MGKNFYEPGSLVSIDDTNKSQIGYNQLVSIATDNIFQITSPRGDTLAPAPALTTTTTTTTAAAAVNNIRKTPKEISKLCAPPTTTSNNTSDTNNAHIIINSYNNIHGSYTGCLSSNMQMNFIEPILHKQNSHPETKKVPKLGLEKIFYQNQEKSPNKIKDKLALIDKQETGFSPYSTDKILIEKLDTKDLRNHPQEKEKMEKMEKIDKQHEIKNEKEKNEKLYKLGGHEKSVIKPQLPVSSSNNAISNNSSQNHNNNAINTQSSTKPIMSSNTTIKASLKLNFIPSPHVSQAPHEQLNKPVTNLQQIHSKLFTSSQLNDEEKYESQMTPNAHVEVTSKTEEIRDHKFFEMTSNNTVIFHLINSSDQIDKVNNPHEYQKSHFRSSNHEALLTGAQCNPSKGIISTPLSQQNESKRSNIIMNGQQKQQKCIDKPISNLITLDQGQGNEINNGNSNLIFTPSFKSSMSPESKLTNANKRNEFNKEPILKDEFNLSQVKETFSLIQANKNLLLNTSANNVLMNDFGTLKFFNRIY